MELHPITPQERGALRALYRLSLIHIYQAVVQPLHDHAVFAVALDRRRRCGRSSGRPGLDVYKRQGPT